MGLVLLGKEERSKMRQKCVKIASKMRQNCAEHLWGEHLLGDTDGGKQGCPGNFAGMSRTPGGVQKNSAPKIGIRQKGHAQRGLEGT